MVLVSGELGQNILVARRGPARGNYVVNAGSHVHRASWYTSQDDTLVTLIHQSAIGANPIRLDFRPIDTRPNSLQNTNVAPRSTSDIQLSYKLRRIYGAISSSCEPFTNYYFFSCAVVIQPWIGTNIYHGCCGYYQGDWIYTRLSNWKTAGITNHLSRPSGDRPRNWRCYQRDLTFTSDAFVRQCLQ